MELARIISTNQVEIVACTPQEGARMAQLRNAGFLDYMPSEQPTCESGYKAVDSCVVENGKVVQSWSIEIDTEMIQNQINELEIQLSATDYKVAKCWEYSLVGETLPYDIETLHTERQAIRDEINRLQAML
jgi:hypothetical protein